MPGVNYDAIVILSMEGICEICRSSGALLEFNKMLACTACFKKSIDSVALDFKKHRQLDRGLRIA